MVFISAIYLKIKLNKCISNLQVAVRATISSRQNEDVWCFPDKHNFAYVLPLTSMFAKCDNCLYNTSTIANWESRLTCSTDQSRPLSSKSDHNFIGKTFTCSETLAHGFNFNFMPHILKLKVKFSSGQIQLWHLTFISKSDPKV